MAGIIRPQKAVQVSFSLEPATNALGSLSLLDMAEDFSGLNEWVYKTVEAMPQELKRTNQLALQDAHIHLPASQNIGFPEWLHDLASKDPVALRDQALDGWMTELKAKVGGEIPTSSELLADRWAYLSLAERLTKAKGESFETWFWEKTHNLLKEPNARLNLIVTHFGKMWEQYLEPEWERSLDMLTESVRAFEAHNLSGLTAVEALKKVALRAEIPQQSLDWLAKQEQMVFIPSPHSGPYLIQMSGHDSSAARFLYGARIPEGVSTGTPSLTRSELLMRLNALANDTRLRILEHLAHHGELGTPEIMDQLGISQSAAARHLEHLTATGYLTSRRIQGINRFQVNMDRIGVTFEAVELFLRGGKQG